MSALGGSQHCFERLHREAAGLRGMEGGAAAREDDPRVGGQLAVGRHAPQPVGLREDRTSGFAGHSRLYTIAPCAPPADNERPKEIPSMSVYERNTLSNGLRVLTAPLPHAQSVACYIMLAAGSRYENAGNRGIAHFAEHMFFKGTEKRPTARDLSMEVDKIGGEFNAFTSKEYTGYYIRCAGEQRDTALDVLVDMIRNSKFDSEELEREKGVIIEEMNMYIDTPRDYVSSLYEELLFGSNPLGWETLGTRETIKAASRETFLDYLRHWYTPSAWSSACRAWSATTCCRRSRGCSATCRATAPTRPSRRRSSSRPHRSCGFIVRTPTRRTSASASRATRSTIPTVMRCSCSGPCSGPACRRASSSRCGNAAGSPTTSTRSTARSPMPGTLFSQAGVDLKRADEAVDVIATEFRKLAEEPVPSDELEKARALAKGRFVLQTESPNGLILFGLRREVLEGQRGRADRGARRARRRHGGRSPAGRPGRDRQRRAFASP